MQTQTENQTLLREQPERTAPRLAAPADVYETPEAWHLAVALPGVRREDLEVELEGDELRVKGHRPAFEREGFRPVRGRLAAGVFERTFLVPEGLTAEQVEADLRHGLLHLTLRKPAPERRSIPVRIA
jgi:HSP20 family protein